jgi:hypothetical protein
MYESVGHSHKLFIEPKSFFAFVAKTTILPIRRERKKRITVNTKERKKNK